MENDIKKVGIYRIYCKANGKSYYGQTNDYDRRMIEHRKLLRHHSKKKHHCTHLQRAWNLYSEDQFEFSLLEECSVELLNEREQWYFERGLDVPNWKMQKDPDWWTDYLRELDNED